MKWVKCLRDSARYNRAMEDEDRRGREIWSNVVRMWYNNTATDQSPDIGRIQHHLAMLARSDTKYL